jgi:hypothetical protein
MFAVTSDGSAYTRFQRALAARNPLLIRTTAADLPRVELGDALAIALVLLDVEPERYGRAAARWHARFCLEVKGVDLAESSAVLALLGGLTGASQVGAAQALASVCETHGIPRAAKAIDAWLAPRA